MIETLLRQGHDTISHDIRSHPCIHNPSIIHVCTFLALDEGGCLLLLSVPLSSLLCCSCLSRPVSLLRASYCSILQTQSPWIWSADRSTQLTRLSFFHTSLHSLLHFLYLSSLVISVSMSVEVAHSSRSSWVWASWLQATGLDLVIQEQVQLP